MHFHGQEYLDYAARSAYVIPPKAWSLEDFAMRLLGDESTVISTSASGSVCLNQQQSPQCSYDQELAFPSVDREEVEEIISIVPLRRALDVSSDRSNVPTCFVSMTHLNHSNSFARLI